MRTLDRALPVVALDDAPTIAHWPVRPVIALQCAEALTLWDTDALWDDGEVWDDEWCDATCSWTGMEIEHGESDEAGLFPSSRCVFQLDNADGEWSAFNIDGTPVKFGPGQALIVYATDGVESWWLFAGRVASWNQRADDTVEVEAFDMMSDLNQGIGTYTPGTNGQQLGVRLEAILSAAGESQMRHRFAVGTAALTAQETDQTPLEEMQTVTGSDGALLYVDADGTLVATDRLWRAGRDDQDAVPILSDNVCTAPIIVWDAELSTTDVGLADTVVLENIAGLKATDGDINTPGGYVLAFTEQQWTSQVEGNILAGLYLNDHQPRRVNVGEFTLYLNDANQPDLWQAVDWRRLDNIRFLHDQKVVGGTLQRVDITTLIDSITHDITPDGWTMTVGTSKAVSFAAPILYDTALEYDTAKEYGY